MSTTAPIHINKTGRVCFNKEAREHMGEIPTSMKLTIAIRLEPEGPFIVSHPTKDVVYISEGQTRPLLEPLGFDGSRSYDIDPKRLPNGGFEFEFRP